MNKEEFVAEYLLRVRPSMGQVFELACRNAEELFDAYEKKYFPKVEDTHAALKEAINANKETKGAKNPEPRNTDGEGIHRVAEKSDEKRESKVEAKERSQGKRKTRRKGDKPQDRS